MRTLSTFVAFFLALSFTGPLLAAEPGGVWLTEKGDAALAFSHCGDGVCGRITWLEDPTDKAGAALVDDKNPDRALQRRPVCGIPVMDLQATGSASWEGSAYNPQDGRTYRAKVRLLSDDRLRIRAYLGVPMLGRSETWTRAKGHEDSYSCDARTALASRAR